MCDINVRSILKSSINIPGQTIYIDGIESDVSDFEFLAETWMGSTIVLTEMEISNEETNVLATWNGAEIIMNLCAHEEYNLSMFIEAMNSWQGVCLTIGHSGPGIFKQEFIDNLVDVKYKQLRFQRCTLPHEFVIAICNKANILKLDIVISKCKIV
jgi:hypothetical protein